MFKNLFVSKRFKKELEQEHLIDIFEQKKRELNRLDNFEAQKPLLREMSLIARKIPHLKGWPYNAKVFWDDDALIWEARIEPEYREFIRKQLSGLKGSTLDIGSGCCPYVDNSVCLDLSYDMLNAIKPTLNELNTHFNSRVQANIEYGFPFTDNTFDNCAMTFTANYITNLEFVFNEIKRILKVRGKLIIVQSVVPVDSYHIILEKHPVKGFEKRLVDILKNLGFKTTIQQKNFKKKSMWWISAVK